MHTERDILLQYCTQPKIIFWFETIFLEIMYFLKSYSDLSKKLNTKAKNVKL